MSNRHIEEIIRATSSELTPGFSVFRALPRRALRRVGGFVFLDHFDAADVAPDQFDVPPHPHIGLQTVTYLYSGAILHRDSLGYEQMIEPGAMNWMTSGRGITHSEQVTTKLERLTGLQLWVGLPHAHRKTEPSFEHFAAPTFPEFRSSTGAVVRVLAGAVNEFVSPLRNFQELVFVDVAAENAASVELRIDKSHELAVYVSAGQAKIGDTVVGKFDLAKLSPGETLSIELDAETRLAVIGGEPLPEPTVIYWNFIADTMDEAKKAMSDWENGLFPVVEHYQKIT